MSRIMSSEENMSGVFLFQKSEVLCMVLLKSIVTVSNREGGIMLSISLSS